MLIVKPLDCDLGTVWSASEQIVFDANCVNLASDPKPTIYVNSDHALFNVTNAATFEDLIFQGNDNYAFYTESPNAGEPISEFPTMLCDPTSVDTSNHGFDITAIATVPFKYNCVRPSYLSTGPDSPEYP